MKVDWQKITENNHPPMREWTKNGWTKIKPWWAYGPETGVVLEDNDWYGFACDCTRGTAPGPGIDSQSLYLIGHQQQSQRLHQNDSY